MSCRIENGKGKSLNNRSNEHFFKWPVQRGACGLQCCHRTARLSFRRLVLHLCSPPLTHTHTHTRSPARLYCNRSLTRENLDDGKRDNEGEAEAQADARRATCRASKCHWTSEAHYVRTCVVCIRLLEKTAFQDEIFSKSKIFELMA